MRAATAYLRTQLSEQYPQRMWKVVEVPLLFAGEQSELRYAAVLPERVAGGGVYYFRLAVVGTGEKSQLVQERIIPDTAALRARVPRCRTLGARRGDRGAQDRYFGRDAKAADVDVPSWRDRWRTGNACRSSCAST